MLTKTYTYLNKFFYSFKVLPNYQNYTFFELTHNQDTIY